jgi:acetyl/propionyl-CoA carboxylase alpha subunit
MTRFVNGDEVELDPTTAELVEVGGRLFVRTASGSFSAVAIRVGSDTLISYRGNTYLVQQQRPRQRPASLAESGELRARMPGLIVDVRSAVGQVVQKGDTLVVLEAMKTQQSFLAPFDGTVTQIPVVVGEQVTDGMILAVVAKTLDNHG